MAIWDDLLSEHDQKVMAARAQRTSDLKGGVPRQCFPIYSCPIYCRFVRPPGIEPVESAAVGYRAAKRC